MPARRIFNYCIFIPRSKMPRKTNNNITPQLPPKRPLATKYLYLILASISFIIYANTLKNGYVMDDTMVLKENTIVTKGIKAIPELLTTPHLHGYINIPNDMYRPLSLVLFAIEYQFFGANPFVGHLANIFVFIACVLLLFLFLDKLFEKKKTTAAFIAALFFAIHPIHTEVVANIKSSDELLCYMFSLLSLILFMNYMKDGKIVQLILGVATLFLAYISKETVITFLFIVPLLFFFYCNDNKRRATLITAGTIFATLLFLVIRAAVLNKYNANQLNTNIDFTVNALTNAPSLSSRIATEFLVLGMYLKLLIIPYPLLCNYSYNSIPFAGFTDVGVLCAIVAYIGIAFIAISRLVKKKKDPWAFGILFFLITISLFSNFFFLIGNEMAERFLFFPSTGFCLLVALAIDQWIVKNKDENIRFYIPAKAFALLSPVLLVFSGMTIARNNDWQNNYTLYKTDLEKSPNDCRLYYYLANNISGNQTDTTNNIEASNESISYLQQALSIYPDFIEAHTALARLYTLANMYDAAATHDLRALALEPSNSIAAYNLGCIYYKQRKYGPAIELFKKTITLSPGFKFSYLNLARCFADYKQYDSAIIYFHRLLLLDSQNIYAYQGMATAFAQRQNIDSTEYYFNQVIALKPSDPEMRNNLGTIYLGAKKIPQAIEQFQKAINIAPAYAVAYGNLGYAYFLAEQYPDAVEAFKKERSLSPGNRSDIPYIAISYWKMKEPDSAKRYEQLTK